ncbi:MAG TPA: branched-chain amino acid ABC transporter permease [Alphaproteobacteria bacterium]|nr:branched-chain amino acid ABC transporter permease [Alphaproteobacteria bacterium]
MIALALDVISSAAILFIISSGLLIIFGVMKILNFAHAGLLSFGGYMALTVTQLGWSPWLAAPFALVAGFLAGALIEQTIMRWLYARSLDAILAAWGLGMILVQLITITYGRQIQFVQTPLSGAITIFGETYSLYRLFLVLVAIALGIILTAVLKGTRLGLNTRAVIMNDNLAQALGINSAWVRFLSFSLGSALAAMAGALITPLSSVNPNMGFSWLISSFMIALLSGSSLVSLAVSSLVLGGTQVLVSTFINPVAGGMTIVVLAAIILRIRPEGFVNE